MIARTQKGTPMPEGQASNTRKTTLDRLGSVADDLFLTLPKLIKPFKPALAIDQKTYEEQIDFYFNSGFVENPRYFFQLPELLPDYEVAESRAFLDGTRSIYRFDSHYRPQNPMLKDKFLSFEENRTAWLIKWAHGDTGRKTLLCLHGYLLGDPDQAERMFKIEKLYQMGLDVALFITPFHWRRAPKSRRLKGIFLQPEDAPMTCECFGQTMHDLYQCIGLLEQHGANEIGIVGASLGGYNAALIASLTDRIRFSALMVPAIKFNTGDFRPDAVRHPFAVDDRLLEKIRSVWTLHSPLNFMPQIPADRILIIAARGDKLCPFENVLSLCEKWGWPRHLFMTGGHWLMFNAKARGRTWYRFLSDMGFDH